jgi:hypothetical protein
VVIKNQSINFGKTAIYLSKCFHQKVLYQRIDSGTIFFIGLGLLYFLFTLFVEYFLWLKPMEEPFYFGLSLGRSLFVVPFYFVPNF